jgi:hypothetical protein
MHRTGPPSSLLLTLLNAHKAEHLREEEALWI